MAPPKVRAFNNTYAKTANDVNRDTLDASLRSFMDSGEDLFKDETFDGKSRNEVITRVRQNILRRMREENAASKASADAERTLHGRYSAKIVEKINEAKVIKREIQKSDADYAMIHGMNDVGDKARALQYLNDLIDQGNRDREADLQLLNAPAEEAPVQLQEGNAELNEENDQNDESQQGVDNEELNQGFDMGHEDEEAEEDPQQVQQRLWNMENHMLLPTRRRASGRGQVSEQSVRERESDLSYLIQLRTELQNTHVERKGKLAKFFSFVSIRSNSNRSKNEKRRTKLQNKLRSVHDEADKWARVRNAYAESVYKKHYDNYDRMAKSWYEMTQEYSVEGDGELPDDLVTKRTIPEDSAKAIVEYTGIYDDAGLNVLLNRVSTNPYAHIAPEDLPIKESKETKETDESGNRADRANHTKTHRKFVLYSETGANGLKTRYKFARDLMGRRSKRQFREGDKTALSLVNDADEGFFDDVYAGRAGLESDEVDINGRKLHSEKSAEVLKARVARNKQRVHGFFLNGEYYSDEEAEEGQKLATRHDLKYFGRRSFTKQEKAEKLREAIRKSAFFQHVNAATIQYYSSYNAADDYLDDVRDAIDEKWEKAEEKNADNGKEAVLERLMNDPDALSGLPKDLRGPAVFEYVKDKLLHPGENPFPAENPVSDAVVAWLSKSGDRASKLSLLTLLLAEDDSPALWRIARKLIIDGNGGVDSRTVKMAGRLPEQGQMMRMGLLDELINHQGRFSEFDLETPLGFIKPAGLSVTQQELDNKRGVGAWIKRNLLNGNIIKEAFSAVGTGFEAADFISDLGHTDGSKDWSVSEEKQERRDERTCWFLYGETMAEGSALGGLLGVGAVVTGGLLGGTEGASRARDGYFQAVDALGMISDVKDVVSAIWGAIKKFYNKFIKKKTAEEKAEEAREKAEALEDMDLGTLRSVLKFLTSLLNLADGVRDIASYHVDADPEKGNWEGWGNLLAWRGPLQWVFDTARNLIGIVNDIAEIIVTTRRINKIANTDKELETAITAFNANGNGPALEQPGLQPNEVGNEAANEAANEHGDQEVEEVDPLAQKRELGKAAAENSQAQYFMALTKAKSRKSRSAAAWDMASTTLRIGRDTVRQFAMTGEPISLIAMAALTIAPKVVDFIGWTVGKLKYDRGNFKDNIASMLGDKKYAKTPYFDKVLKRETGIVSSDYLVDVARIFTAIDTHVLFNKEDKTAGEKDLAVKVAGTLYGNVRESNLKKIKLDKMLAYSGFSDDSDWRAVLRHAITG